VGQVLKFGCLGIVGLVILGIVIAVATPKGSQTANSGGTQTNNPGAAKPAAPPAATIGDTVAKGGWEVTITNFGPYEDFGARPASPPPQGKLVVAEFTAKNLQQRISNFTTNDFTLQTGDGRKFTPAGPTASIDKGFVISQTVQPGLTTNNRVVFDIDPAATDLTLTALGIPFHVPVE